MRTIDEARGYAAKWGLTKLEPVENLSVNLVLRCDSPYGVAILKLCHTETFTTEYNALSELRGRVCRVYEVDTDGRALLLERLEPGTTLKAEPSLERRLQVFTELYANLHAEPSDASVYETYLDWVQKAAEYMRGRSDYQELCSVMLRADEFCCELFDRYPERVLLHGDFHGDNILLGPDGYAVIDPKGVVGPPLFDLPRYMLNEYGDEPEIALRPSVMNRMIEVFGEKFGFPAGVLKKAYFIEQVMAVCWSLEYKGRVSERSAEGITFAVHWFDKE